jgi:hypothetical protein
MGKNSLSRKYCIINSEAWEVTRDQVVPLPYLNVGLLTGQAKLTGKQRDLEVPSWYWWERVRPGSFQELRSWRRFCHYHREELEAITDSGRYQAFAAAALGGLGLTVPDGLVPSVTRWQKAVAFSLLKWCEKPRSTLPRYLGLSTSGGGKTIIFPRKRLLRFVPADRPLQENEYELRVRTYRRPMSENVFERERVKFLRPRVRLPAGQWPQRNPIRYLRLVSWEPRPKPKPWSGNWWDSYMSLYGDQEYFYFT